MEKEFESTRKNGFLDSLKFEPILKERADAIKGDLFGECNDYRTTFKYVNRIAKSFIKRYSKELEEFDFTDKSLTEIVSAFEYIMERNYVDHINFYFPRSKDKPFAFYRYTEDLGSGLIDLTWLIEKEWYSEEILSALWYLHNQFGVKFLEEDYEMELENVNDLLRDDEINDDWRWQLESSKYNYKKGFLSGYLSMLKRKEPSRTIDQCISGISNHSIVELLKLLKSGYNFDADNNCYLIDADEYMLQPSYFFGFVWTHDEDDFMSRRIIEDKDEQLGNYTCTLIGEKIELHQIRKKIKFNHNLKKTICLIKNI